MSDHDKIFETKTSTICTDTKVLGQVSRKRKVPTWMNDNKNASEEVIESGDTVVKDGQTQNSNNTFYSASSLLQDDYFRPGMTYSYDQKRKWLFLGGGFDVAKAQLSTTAKGKLFFQNLLSIFLVSKLL